MLSRKTTLCRLPHCYGHFPNYPHLPCAIVCIDVGILSFLQNLDSHFAINVAVLSMTSMSPSAFESLRTWDKLQKVPRGEMHNSTLFTRISLCPLSNDWYWMDENEKALRFVF